MIEGLEALERIKDYKTLDDCLVIEKDLEALKELDKHLDFSDGALMSGFDYKGQQIVVMPLKGYDKLMKKDEALNIISQNFRLVGNCLHAKNEYAEDGWVFVKELVDEEELEAWEEVLINE